jgi:MarR family transcriptional repressor of emrRAB
MASDERTANLLGALALTLTDSVGAALDDEAGVTGTDAAALITLHNYAGESLDILRGVLGLSQPGMVRVVDRLERRGLLRRRRAERDARAIALELTPSGRRVAQAAARARGRAVHRALQALDAGEQRALAGLLEKMLAAETTGPVSARVICRLCDPDACGHPQRCPVTQALR